MLTWIHTYESYWLFLFLFLGLLIELHSNYVLRLEYKYDKDKDDQKKQKKTRTTKKTTQTKDGGSVVEESTEVTEPIKEQCKHENTWFDRTISYDKDGKESGMHTICSDCGLTLN